MAKNSDTNFSDAKNPKMNFSDAKNSWCKIFWQNFVAMVISYPNFLMQNILMQKLFTHNFLLYVNDFIGIIINNDYFKKIINEIN